MRCGTRLFIEEQKRSAQDHKKSTPIDHKKASTDEKTPFGRYTLPVIVILVTIVICSLLTATCLHTWTGPQEGETSQPVFARDMAAPETNSPPVDSDSDGVPDSVDSCYNPGCSLVNGRGCPADTDGDGLQDCYDDCPNERGDKANRGCPSTQNAVTAIEICAVNYNAGGDDNYNLNGEWVRICNTGNQDITMTGWTLYDNAYLQGQAKDHVFHFPSGFVLRAGESVTIYTGTGMNTPSALYWQRTPGDKQAVWNNDGDCAYLVDSQRKIIDDYCW